MTLKIMPIGSRIFVDPIEPVIDIEARAQAAGLHVVIDEANIPKPTEGKVIAVGSDPLLQELCAIGDTVYFSMHAGINVIVEGRTYRSLDLRDIVAVVRDVKEADPLAPSRTSAVPHLE